MKRIVVIGNGKMAVDCLKIMKAARDAEISMVITEADGTAWGNAVIKHCEKNGIPCMETPNLNADDVVAALSGIGPDVVFSINSYRIIKRRILSIPKEGIINFHNGPLPRYGGVNVCSWAIINGETQHGVTWHYLDEGIDTGDIIDQRRIGIAQDETAISLIMKCISAGVASFREVLPRVLDGSAPRQKQDPSKATYFSRKDIPNGGSINFAWSYPVFDRFIRGLSFHPMPNSFVYPRSTFDAREFLVERIERVAATPAGDCGKVVSAGRDRITVQIADSLVAITDVLDDARKSLAMSDFVESYGIRVGAYLGL
jgi:methionyl-tRNA formyltransferase